MGVLAWRAPASWLAASLSCLGDAHVPLALYSFFVDSFQRRRQQTCAQSCFFFFFPPEKNEYCLQFTFRSPPPPIRGDYTAVFLGKIKGGFRPNTVSNRELSPRRSLLQSPQRRRQAEQGPEAKQIERVTSAPRMFKRAPCISQVFAPRQGPQCDEKPTGEPGGALTKGVFRFQAPSPDAGRMRQGM